MVYTKNSSAFGGWRSGCFWLLILLAGSSVRLGAIDGYLSPGYGVALVQQRALQHRLTVAHLDSTIVDWELPKKWVGRLEAGLGLIVSESLVNHSERFFQERGRFSGYVVRAMLKVTPRSMASRGGCGIGWNRQAVWRRGSQTENRFERQPHRGDWLTAVIEGRREIVSLSDLCWDVTLRLGAGCHRKRFNQSIQYYGAWQTEWESGIRLGHPDRLVLSVVFRQDQLGHYRTDSLWAKGPFGPHLWAQSKISVAISRQF